MGLTADGAFFGRGKICALLEKRIEAFQKGYRQNVGIVAPPFFGKSFLIETLLRRLAPSELLIVPFRCQPFDSFERFALKWMGELLFSSHGTLKLGQPVDIQQLIGSLKGLLPKTLRGMRSVRSLASKRRYDQAYQELMSLSGILQQECGKKILVILDDFDHLSELGLKDAFGDLGKEIMIQKETMFVFTSSQSKRSLSIFREKLSLLFGNFEVVELNHFDFDESGEFIDVRLPECKFEEELKRFLIRLTDGHPYYLDFLVKRFRSYSRPEAITNRDLIIDSLTTELFEDCGTLYQHFQARLRELAQGRPWPLFGEVLAAVARGHKKLSEMIRFLGRKGNEIKKILEKLLESEAIEKHGSVFQIHDPLFRFWLAKVYHRRHFLWSRSQEANSVSFRADLGEAIEESIREDARELPKKIEELFLMFRNDVVQLSGKRFQCPHFTEVTSRPNNGRVFPVLARNARTRWLCQVLAGKVTEDDIHLFLQDLKRLRARVDKKLIIGLRGIELNAKLLAQEAKIRYLDLRSLNLILDLYGKPKFVL